MLGSADVSGIPEQVCNGRALDYFSEVVLDTIQGSLQSF